jgi:hypothetical protein
MTMMNLCSAQLETGNPCTAPAQIFDPQRGKVVCFGHTLHRFKRGEKVRIRQKSAGGHPLPQPGQEGIIFTLLRGGCYEVRLRGQSTREIYYDWELDRI